MLHIVELNIANKADWGRCYQTEIVLPSKIRRIKSVFANAVLGEDSLLKRLIIDDVAYDYISAQIANISVVLNNTNIVLNSAPLFATSVLKKSGVNNSRIELPKAIDVLNGSTLRLVVEEKEKTPFEMNADAITAIKNSDLSVKTEEPKNDYKVKLYIEY